MIYIYITKNQRETERAPMAASPAPHVVLFPVPGQGHVNPFMAIAEFLAAHGITVTFVHTRRSYAVLTSASSPNLQTLNHHHHHPTASHSDEKNGGCIRIEVVPDAMPADLKQKISSDHLVASMPLMREGLESLLRRLMAVDPNPKNLSQPPPPSCLIADSFMPWSHDVAVQFKLPRIQVWTSSAAVFSMGYHIPTLLQRGFGFGSGFGFTNPSSSSSCSSHEYLQEIVDFLPGISPLRVADLPQEFQTPTFPFFASLFEHCEDAERILVHTLYELEKPTIDALRECAGGDLRISTFMTSKYTYNGGNNNNNNNINKNNNNNININNNKNNKNNNNNINNNNNNRNGALEDHDAMAPVKSAIISSSSTSLLPEDESCLAWLAAQEEASVLYIAFGSLHGVSEAVLHDLAMAVEASGVKFLWVLRADQTKLDSRDNERNGEKEEEEKKKNTTTTGPVALPQGFVERTKERGLVISWAPQRDVLAHKSVAAFLTHCGWNSVLESLSNGVPMLAYPLGGEQNTNLKYLVQDWGVALPLVDPFSPSPSPGAMSSSDPTVMERAIRTIMKPEGEEMSRLKSRALHWKQVSIDSTSPPNGASVADLLTLVHDLKHGALKFEMKG